MTQYDIATLGIVSSLGIIGIGIGAFNKGVYDETKKRLINKAINGEIIDLTESKKPVYRPMLEKIIGSSLAFLSFGERLAEKKFKAGKFNNIIEKYRPDYHSNS